MTEAGKEGKPARLPGRPRVSVTPHQVRELRSQGMAWRPIAKLLAIGTATAMRLMRATIPS